MDTTILDSVRAKLLEEAKASPGLLSDLAGLEGYIAESYDSRSFIELLQNADDAGAGRFWIRRQDDILGIANDGRPFNRSDFESLCSSASSTKTRGQSIGYRGIGFKSVVNLANMVHLISPNLAATFSREETAREVPAARKVPLIRIPHPLHESARIAYLKMVSTLDPDVDWTAFVFEGLDIEKIHGEFERFDSSSVLFLKNLEHISLSTATSQQLIEVSRSEVAHGQQSILLTTQERAQRWFTFREGEFCIAVAVEDDTIVPLGHAQAVVHAFLPTLDRSGFPFKVQGDFSTDPSRTRLVFDDRTGDGIAMLAKLYCRLLTDSLRCDSDLLRALVPVENPRIQQLQSKSFAKLLMEAIRGASGEGLHKLLLRPKWLNGEDFEILATASGVWFLTKGNEEIAGLTDTLRFLGAREATLAEISCALLNSKITSVGAAEIAAYICKQVNVKQMKVNEVDLSWPIWQVESGEIVSFNAASQEALMSGYLAMITERIGVLNDLVRVITLIGSEESASRMIGTRSHSLRLPLEQDPVLQTSAIAHLESVAVKKWRRTEQQVQAVLEAKGWTLRDVSKQNLGYDLEGKDPAGRLAYVEVKSVDYVGQSFSLTSNEFAVAQHKGRSYILALAKQLERCVDIALFSHPVKALSFNQQCRQWVWECSEYQFQAERFEFE